jgi:hypothetical protein
MFKAICTKDNCDNKDIVYYIPEVEEQTMCGGCKEDITPIEMTQEEYDSVFDYDPFAVTPLP